jgi:hypothetical protein
MTNKTNKQPSLIGRFVNITDDSLFMFDRILTDVAGGGRGKGNIPVHLTCTRSFKCD